MVRIAPVRLSFNPKTLWFDAQDFHLSVGDAVVVQTARGIEFGHLVKPVFDVDYEQIKQLRSPLKPVVRLASEQDEECAEEAASLSAQALPLFRQLAETYAPDMNPIAVEYLFEGGKAVFYFEAEERVDFRDLVRRLAADLQIRVDMKQIGVRDGARMVGGIGHCGQELCCARLGGDFNPVSIRMAKEQDLSLNPQKISGVCGRLMCCLRYEFEAYKDFHARAPKKNARIETPDGEGKVIDFDVPREIISIKVGDEKPVKVPLADMEPAEDGARPRIVGEEAWERAQEPASLAAIESSSLFATELTGEDKLADPSQVIRPAAKGDTDSPRRRRRRSASSRSGAANQGSHQTGENASQQHRKQRRRRSTVVSGEGERQQGAKGERGDTQTHTQKDASAQQQNSRRRRRVSLARDQQAQQNRQSQGAQGQQSAREAQSGSGKSVQVGRNSSGLRAAQRGSETPHSEHAGQTQANQKSGKPGARRRRRSHKPKTQE